jgi:hypothetical protein
MTLTKPDQEQSMRRERAKVGLAVLLGLKKAANALTTK